ncbi:MAG TPA: substrate-binding domain-containing protein [Steroidobacteraceae bacterium]|nr:substrate-binding domain-containing protein [Steroidobacteraceae bacterium]
MNARRTGIAVGICLAASIGSARSLNLPPSYTPGRQVSGTIRLWGHGAYDRSRDFIGSLVRAWERGFRRYQPGVHFENHLVGTATAAEALYTGNADLALLGREIWPPEVAAFKEMFGYPPTGVNVATGSFNVRNRDYALVIFVHKSNPLDKLTLEQLHAIFGAECRGCGPVARSWGDLGLSGAWRDRPIHLYGLPISRGFARFFEDEVFIGRRLWRPSLREFADLKGSRGGATDGGQRMLDALAQDPDGIGYAGLLYTNPDVKPVALAARPGGPYVEPTETNVLAHRYPLTRMITIYLNRAPGRPVDPKLEEFLRFVLSREGQQDVLRQGRGYLPLLAPFAAAERSKIP